MISTSSYGNEVAVFSKTKVCVLQKASHSQHTHTEILMLSDCDERRRPALMFLTAAAAHPTSKNVKVIVYAPGPL